MVHTLQPLHMAQLLCLHIGQQRQITQLHMTTRVQQLPKVVVQLLTQQQLQLQPFQPQRRSKLVIHLLVGSQPLQVALK